MIEVKEPLPTESLTGENFHAWIDSLRAAGIEVIEEEQEIPELNPLAPRR